MSNIIPFPPKQPWSTHAAHTIIIDNSNWPTLLTTLTHRELRGIRARKAAGAQAVAMPSRVLYYNGPQGVCQPCDVIVGLCCCGAMHTGQRFGI